MRAAWSHNCLVGRRDGILAFVSQSVFICKESEKQDKKNQKMINTSSDAARTEDRRNQKTVGFRHYPFIAQSSHKPDNCGFKFKQDSGGSTILWSLVTVQFTFRLELGTQNPDITQTLTCWLLNLFMRLWIWFVISFRTFTIHYIINLKIWGK